MSEMKDYGLVSVVMPSWNCGRYVEESVRSVLAQTYRNWELLFQDDCSSDDTRVIIERLAAEDPRIRYACNEYNSGAAVTRNAALRRARGRWIAFLDSDDLWQPQKLEHQLEFMAKNGYAFSYHAYQEISERRKPLGVHVRGKRHVGRLGMMSCCWPGCLAVMYDAEAIGLVQIADVRKNNDTALWLKVIRKADCHFLDQELALYRRRKGSITPPGIMTRIKWHYTLFRVAERMNPVAAFFWMCMNVAGNGYKKLFYVNNK